MPTFDAAAEVKALDRTLRGLGSPARAAQEARYLKSSLQFRGTGVPAVRATAKGWWRAHREVGLPALRALARALWATEVHELRSVGVAVLELAVGELEAADAKLLEDLLRKADTWAHVDWLSANVMGRLVPRFPALGRTLDRWARDDSFWVRRSALLSLLEPLRAGGGDWERFEALAAPMVGEKEFFIRKAIGWVLREVSKKRPALAEGFLAAHAREVSGLTFREGSKYLPAAARARLERLRA